MKHRICPNCGNSSPDAAAGCQCGFLWNEGVDVPAPDIVRARVGQRSAVEQVDPEETNQEQGSSAAHEKQDHPLHVSSGPRRRATAPATFGSNSVSKPRTQPGPRNKKDNKSEDAVFLGMGEETMVITDNMAVEKVASGNSAPAASTSSPNRPNAALLMECPACDARISKRAARCPKCNTAPYQPCQVCAMTIMVNSESCGECGDPDPFNVEALGDARA